MRIDRYTQKMQEALQAAQDLASQSNHPEITNEHFLSTLLEQSEGIARPLLEKIGANVDQLQERLRTELERRPKIHGTAADLRISTSSAPSWTMPKRRCPSSRTSSRVPSIICSRWLASRKAGFLRQNC